MHDEGKRGMVVVGGRDAEKRRHRLSRVDDHDLGQIEVYKH